MAANRPRIVAVVGRNSPAAQSTNRLRCFLCGEIGHVVRSCALGRRKYTFLISEVNQHVTYARSLYNNLGACPWISSMFCKEIAENTCHTKGQKSKDLKR